MGIVVLVSGGVDSSVISALAAKEGVRTYPLFIDYGQRSAKLEWQACQNVHRRCGLPRPKRMRVPGFGNLVPSGLTKPALRINEDAFLPCRNLFFLVCAAAYAYAKNASAIAIGLIDETAAIFPDQTGRFLATAEGVIEHAVGRHISVVAPLLHVSKTEVLALSRGLGLHDTYSCHAGTAKPCGLCISCVERQLAED